MEEGEKTKLLEFFSQMLANPSPERRWKAAEALGRSKDPNAVDPLIRALRDEDWRVRQKAAWALGFIGDPRALQPLRRLLTDSVEGVRDMAQQASDDIRAAMYR